jgi:hypothetical protein
MKSLQAKACAIVNQSHNKDLQSFMVSVCDKKKKGKKLSYKYVRLFSIVNMPTNPFVKEYSGNSYTRVNKFLRGSDKKLTLKSWASPKNKKYKIGRLIKEVSSSLMNHPLPRSVTVYRGLSKKIAKTMENLKVGETFIEKGFLSTSFGRSIAQSWAGKKGLVMEIHAPKGSPGIWIGQLAFTTEEDEVLFDAGAHLVLKKRKSPKHLVFDMVPPSNVVKSPPTKLQFRTGKNGRERVLNVSTGRWVLKDGKRGMIIMASAAGSPTSSSSSSSSSLKHQNKSKMKIYKAKYYSIVGLDDKYFEISMMTTTIRDLRAELKKNYVSELRKLASYLNSHLDQKDKTSHKISQISKTKKAVLIDEIERLNMFLVTTTTRKKGCSGRRKANCNDDRCIWKRGKGCKQR